MTFVCVHEKSHKCLKSVCVCGGVVVGPCGHRRPGFPRDGGSCL